MLHVTNVYPYPFSAVVALGGGFTLHVLGAVVLDIFNTKEFLGDTNCVVFSRYNLGGLYLLSS